jgi:3-oxoacyl-[acyl-carrier protein] reductase
MQLVDKVVIVTGAGRGIGRAIALRLAQAGAHIVIAEYAAEQATAVAHEVRELGGQALAVPTDVTQESSVAAMLAQTLEHFGTVDLLVANAGIQRRYFVHELPAAEFSAMLSVNLLGVFHSCKAVLPTFYARKSGNIIIISSDSGKHGYTHNAAYCASKFGVLGFMEALADEARAYKVRVNAICPAGVRTAMSAATPLIDGGLLDTRFFMEPEEIADVALFLATSQSRAIHGQALQVYGGVDYQLL